MVTLKNIEEKLGTGDFWDEKADAWIDANDLIKNKNFIAFGDDGGDTFIKSANDSTDLINKLKKHLAGDTNCDFTTEIYLIVQDGIKKSVADFIK